MFKRLKSLAARSLTLFEQGSGAQAATLLPPVAPPKPPKPGGAAYSGYRKTVVASKAAIQKPNFNIANVDLTSTYRTAATTSELVRNLVRISPEAAASVSANNRVGIPEKYIAIARDPDGSFNRDATQLALQILRQMNTMPDYINGFSHVGSLRSVCEALGKEIQTEGAMAMELVLDKQRLPFKFQPVPVATITLYDDDKALRPTQKIGGEEIDLDIATFFWTAIDPSLYNAYPQSPLEAAVQPILAGTTFLSDLRKLCGRHIYQRYDISIDEEKLRARIPDHLLNDPDKLAAYLDECIADVEAAITDLGVEEALIHFDFFEVKYIEGSTDTPATLDTVRSIYDGKTATALKTPPSILGMGSRTAGIADVETLMFMVNANGLIRLKLNEILSKGMTLAVRLFGLDVTVEFEFDDIELRPSSELEAYRAMAQERITTLVSLGYMTDEEACLRLTGQLPPTGFTPHFNTMYKNPAPVAPAANPDSGTSNLGGNKNKTPEQAKGPAK